MTSQKSSSFTFLLSLFFFLTYLTSIIQSSITTSSEKSEKLSTPQNNNKNNSKIKTKIKKKSKNRKNVQKKNQDQCFCQLSNKAIHDTNCLCNVNDLISYNEHEILPLVSKLVLTDFFRFYKVNINRGCAYWNEPYYCTTNQCGIAACTSTELPPALQQELQENELRKVLNFDEEGDDDDDNGNDKENKTEGDCNQSINQDQILTSELSNIVDSEALYSQEKTIEQLFESLKEQDSNALLPEMPGFNTEDLVSDLTNQQLKDMHKHWDLHDEKTLRNLAKEKNNQIPEKENNEPKEIWEREFCISEEDDQDAMYYDLLKNPERYTGYNGKAAHRVWRKIYEENCYAETESKSFHFGQFNSNLLDELEPSQDKNWWKKPNEVIHELECVEKRVFFRAVSGMHSSISLHIAMLWYYKESFKFGPNLEEFKRRFENANGSQYIHNLYFVWLLELRALDKVSNLLTDQDNIRNIFHTGDVHTDIKGVNLKWKL